MFFLTAYFLRNRIPFLSVKFPYNYVWGINLATFPLFSFCNKEVSLELQLCGTKSSVDAFSEHYHLKLFKTMVQSLSSHYPQDLHFCLSALTFISHTSIRNLVNWRNISKNKAKNCTR